MTLADLRHSYAVAALQSGDDIKTVQENLGHHTAAFTLDVYGHVSEHMKEASAQRMQQYIEAMGLTLLKKRVRVRIRVKGQRKSPEPLRFQAFLR